MSNELLQLGGVAAVLSIAVLMVMLMPLVNKKKQSAMQRVDYDLKVYRDQLEEIDHDLERGLLTDEQAVAAGTEIKRRILAAADVGGQTATPGMKNSTSNWALISFIAVILPLGATVMYLGLGRPDLQDQPLAGRDMSASIAEAERRNDFSQAVAQLAEKLESQPDDMRGWALLGRSYVNLERFDAAAKAYSRAYELSGNNPNAGSAYGEALALAANSVITPKATLVFEAVIAADPANLKARYYLAMRKMQIGDLGGAMQSWIDLAAILPDEAPLARIINGNISRTAEESGIDPKSIEPTADAVAVAARLQNTAQNTKTPGVVDPQTPGLTSEEAISPK